MSTITPHYRTVKQLLQSQSFAVDEYQREYKWEEENIDELLAYLRDKFLNCYAPGDEIRKLGCYDAYFLGSIIVSKHNRKRYAAGLTSSVDQHRPQPIAFAVVSKCTCQDKGL